MYSAGDRGDERDAREAVIRNQQLNHTRAPTEGALFERQPSPRRSLSVPRLAAPHVRMGEAKRAASARDDDEGGTSWAPPPTVRGSSRREVQVPDLIQLDDT